MTAVDISMLTLKILSAIYRSQEKYGAYLIAESLCGSKSKKLLDLGLDKISTFNIVDDMTIGQIIAVIKYHLQVGLLYRSTEHANLKLSAQGKQFLKNKPIFTIPQHILDQAKTGLFAPKLLATHQATLQLWQDGKNIKEIAAIRNLAKSTIETHLADLIYHRQINDITSLISSQQLATVIELHESNPSMRLKELKEALPVDLTYGQIRIALATQHHIPGM